VSITNDDLTEGDEQFLGRLNILTTGISVAISPQDNAIATILEDDSKLKANASTDFDDSLAIIPSLSFHW
jgi:hypothetical protein